MTVRYDGVSAETLAARLGAPRMHLFDEVGSTLDIAHQVAREGAVAGTVVLSDSQTAGRGRAGRSWQSESGAGIWLTVIERPTDTRALEVLSLRLGLALAPALDGFADSPVRLKWPNDLYVGGGKLAGVLVEARWRDGAPEWAAIGVGINVRAPAGELRAAGLRDDMARLDVLAAVVPAIRAAALQAGSLEGTELQAFADRDLARGRACVEPLGGVVAGIDAGGALLVNVGSETRAVRAGSLVFVEDP